MELTGQIAAVSLVLALLAATLWCLRGRRMVPLRFPSRSGRKQVLEVMESRALGPGQALHLVRVGDRVMVLAVHSGGCTLLETRPLSEMASS